MTLCMLIGGDCDGAFIELPELPGQRWRDAVVVPKPPTLEWWDADSRSVPQLHTYYNSRKIACPDGWTLWVYVHPDVDIYAMAETEIVSIIMRHWRESHRRRL